MINKLSVAIALKDLLRSAKLAGGIAFSILLITGLNHSSSRVQASEIEEKDIFSNSIEAIQRFLKFGIDLGNLDQEALDTETTKLISFQELIEYLPDTPRGWIAQKPQGETNSFGNYGISQVSQTFNQEDRSKQIKISIYDGAFNSILAAPFQLTTEFERESTEGYNKSIEIDGISGREIYNYSNKQGSLHLLVDSRFLIQIEGSNIEEAELQDWWRSLDRQSLSANDD